MASWIKGLIGFILFFGIIVGYIIETKYLGGYLNLAGIIKNGLLAGAIGGGILGFILKGRGKDQDARFSIFAGLLVIGISTGPLLLSLSNRITCKGATPTNFELISVEPVMKSNIGIIKGQSFKADAHKITLSRNDEIIELELGADIDPNLSNLKEITLDICKGGFGFEYVDPKYLNNTNRPS